MRSPPRPAVPDATPRGCAPSPRAEVGGPGWWPAGNEAADRVGTLSGALAGTGTLVTAGAVALVVVALLATLAGHAPDGGPSVGAVSAAAVQGGGAHGVDKSQVHPAQVLAAQMAATQQMQVLDGGHAPELVLWPEDVVALDESLSQSPEESVLSSLAASLHTTLVVGVTENVSTTAFRNEVVAWGPDGTLVARFEKVHRVPFGEYIPYRSFFSHLASLSAVPLDAIPGTGTGLMATPAAPLGAMVSFEVFYPDRGRSSVRAGAELLVVPTNTASYSTTQVPTQELAAATIQAVQQGRDLLQAAPTGFSAAIDHRGVLEARSVIGAAPGGLRDAGPKERDHPLRPLRRPSGPRRRGGGTCRGLVARHATSRGSRLDVARVALTLVTHALCSRARSDKRWLSPPPDEDAATRSSPNGCTRREFRRRGTWRSCEGRPRTRGAARSRRRAARRPRPA